jgi:hypothetical protein
MTVKDIFNIWVKSSCEFLKDIVDSREIDENVISKLENPRDI